MGHPVQSTVLLVDVGNTRAKVALACGQRILKVTSVPNHPRRNRELTALLDQWAAAPLQGSVLCSVVPEYNADWQKTIRRRTRSEPVLLTHRSRLGAAIDYPRPERIGADRLANACAVAARTSRPVIVADFGTALTFDVVVRRRGIPTYVGGAICPGLSVMIDYLAERTALLPHIELPGVIPAVGRSTEAAMRLGARVGYRGMVREVTDHLCRRLQLDSPALYGTGGGAAWALRGSAMGFRIRPNLTLEGLARVYELNRKG